MAKKKDLLGLNIRYYSNNLKDNKFKGYLAGLFEGDGHIWIQKPSEKKKHNPRFCITFSMKNEPLAKKLLELIGSGFIRYKLQDNACVLVVSPVIGLKKVVHLLNGELRTPKIHKLHNLIDWLNQNHSTNITKLPLKDSSLSENGWLSGFIDSDGSFSVQHTKLENGAKKRKISCRLRIEQRMLDPRTNDSYSKVLTDISNFLNCTLLTRRGNYLISASNDKSLSIIIGYLNKYPLLSTKYLEFKDWEIVANHKLLRTYHSEEVYRCILDLKAGMNMNRKIFNWDHLKTCSLVSNSSGPFLNKRINLNQFAKFNSHKCSFSTTRSLFEASNYSHSSETPVKIYNIPRDKFIIIRENRSKAGVYRFLNLTNGKSYIGSSTNLGRRFSEYLSNYYLETQLDKGRSQICSALLRYGYSAFSLEVIEYCAAKEAISREQHFIDLIRPEYNILTTAGSSLGHLHTEEAKEKMALAWSAERRAKHLEHLNRINSTLEQKEHMQKLYTKKIGGPRSEGSGRPSISIEVIDQITQEKFVYPSIAEAAAATGCTKQGISVAFNRQEKKGVDFILMNNKRYLLRKKT